MADHSGSLEASDSCSGRAGAGAVYGRDRLADRQRERSRRSQGVRGGKKINGRKRHLIVDSLGFLLSVLVTAANLDEGTHAPQVLAKLTSDQTSRLEEIRGDSKYNNRTLDRYLETSQADYKVTVVERPADAKGLVLLPYRWVVERTNAWIGKYRRNSKDYERTTQSSEAMLQVSLIHLMLKRHAPDPNVHQAEFRYPRKSMKKAA